MSFTRTGATALVLWLTLLSMVSAQQSTLSIENAKKEAEVVWYGTLTGGSIVGRITGAFESKYPFIKVKYLRLGGAGLIERIRSEARNGKYLWDVVTSEYIQFFELPKYVTLAKYLPPEIANYSPKHKDPNGTRRGAEGLEGSFGSQVERKKNRPAGRGISMVRRHGFIYGGQSRPGLYESPRGARAANPGGIYKHRESFGRGRISGGDHPSPPHRGCQIKRSAGRLVGGCQPCRSQHSSHRHI